MSQDKFSREMMLRARLDAIRTNASLVIVDEAAKKTALEFASLAERALANDSFEQAWRDIVAGEIVILRQRSNAELVAKVRAIAAEATSAFKPIDAKPVIDMLPDIKSGTPDGPDWKEAVIEAYALYQRRMIELMDGRERAGKRILFLVSALGVLLIAILSIALLYPATLQLCGEVCQAAAVAMPSPLSPDEGSPLMLLLAAIILGGIGACLSGLLSLTVLGQAPGQFESFSITVARPLVGFASGLVAALVATSNMVSIESLSTMLAIAFAFGFSERLVVGAVQKFELSQK